MPPTLTDVDWPYLQNGSDIRGVALAGVPQEAVNLTPAVAQQLGHAFVAWLADQLDKAATDLVNRFKRGYKNVINEAIRLNAAGQES